MLGRLSVCFVYITILVPVVIVFTQYDRLYDQFSYDLAKSGELKNKDKEQRNQRIEKESDKYFLENCVKQLEKIDHRHRPKQMKWVWVSSMVFSIFLVHFVHLCLVDRPEYRYTLKNLTDVTEELVRNHVRESAWVVMAAAQRVNADTKVKSCIA